MRAKVVSKVQMAARGLELLKERAKRAEDSEMQLRVEVRRLEETIRFLCNDAGTCPPTSSASECDDPELDGCDDCFRRCMTRIRAGVREKGMRKVPK